MLAESKRLSGVYGRMKSDCQYSVAIVYNNFPCPEATAT